MMPPKRQFVDVNGEILSRLWGLRVGRLVAAEGLRAQVGEASPEPFGGAEAETGEPQGAPEELEDPDAQDEKVARGAFEVSEVAKAKAKEDEGADDALHEVVGEGHASDGGQAGGEGIENPGLADEHHHGGVCDGSEKTADVVVLGPQAERKAHVALAGMELRGAQGDERQADDVSDRGERGVGPPLQPRPEEAELRERHPDEHEPKAPPERPDGEEKRLEEDRESRVELEIANPVASAGGNLLKQLLLGGDHVGAGLLPPFQQALLRFGDGLTGVQECLGLFCAALEHADDETHADVHDDRDAEDRQADGDEPLGSDLAHRVEQKAAEGVRDQDVAEPDQVGVDHAQKEQHTQAAVVGSGEAGVRGALSSGQTLILKDHAGAKEHREDRHHLLVKDQAVDPPGDGVEPREVAGELVDDGVVGGGVGRDGESVHDDVHGEDAEHGDTAKGVDGGGAAGHLDRRWGEEHNWS